MKVAVIPARGGSKRIPGKNLRPFHGLPMIAWSLHAARDSGCFDRIIVSTDDDAIARIAVEHGAEAPFRRPAELANDHCGTGPVIAHAANWLAAEGQAADMLCCIYATAPFLQASDLERGLAILTETGADFAFSVTSYAFPIQRAIRIGDDGRAAMFQPEHAVTRSQDLEEAWHDAGQFYWGRSQAWIENRPIFGRGGAPVILPRHRVQDIDTLEDWVRAELMFAALGQSE